MLCVCVCTHTFFNDHNFWDARYLTRNRCFCARNGYYSFSVSLNSIYIYILFFTSNLQIFIYIIIQ